MCQSKTWLRRRGPIVIGTSIGQTEFDDAVAAPYSRLSRSRSLMNYPGFTRYGCVNTSALARIIRAEGSRAGILAGAVGMSADWATHLNMALRTGRTTHGGWTLTGRQPPS